MSNRWDTRFMALAALIGSWSKDPSTRVGAVIVDGRRIVSVGFNGFAAGVVDSAERYGDRDTKLKMILHAEDNAILFARRSVVGCTIYTHPFPPCAHCAARIIQAGIVRVVAPAVGDMVARWKPDFDLAAAQYREAGVQLSEVAP